MYRYLRCFYLNDLVISELTCDFATCILSSTIIADGSIISTCYIECDASFNDSISESAYHFATSTLGAPIISDSSIPTAHSPPMYCYLQRCMDNLQLVTCFTFSHPSQPSLLSLCYPGSHRFQPTSANHPAAIMEPVSDTKPAVATKPTAITKPSTDCHCNNYCMILATGSYVHTCLYTTCGYSCHIYTSTNNSYNWWNHHLTTDTAKPPDSQQCHTAHLILCSIDTPKDNQWLVYGFCCIVA